MYNLAKMELYKLFKSISMWIVLAVVIVISVFSIEMTKIDLDLMKEDSPSTQQGIVTDGVEEPDSNELTFGIYFDTDYGWLSGKINTAEYTLVHIRSGLMLIVLSVFISMFVNSENKGGYVKNIAGQINLKGKLIFAKLPALLVFNILMFVVCYFSNALCIKIFFNNADMSISGENFAMLAVQLLLHFAFSCVIMLFTTAIKSTAFGMTLGILLSAMGTLLWTGIDKMVMLISKVDNFMIEKYTLVYNVESLSIAKTDTAIAVGALFFVAASIFAAIIMNNRDVK